MARLGLVWVGVKLKAVVFRDGKPGLTREMTQNTVAGSGLGRLHDFNPLNS